MKQLIDTTICPRILTEVADYLDCNWTTTNSTFRHEAEEFVDLYSGLLVNSMLHMPRYNEIVENDPTYESKWWKQLFHDEEVCVFPNFYCDTYITPFYCNRTEEKEWLRQFYNSAGGTNWTNSTNWMTDTDYCYWFGVKCCSAIPMQYTIEPPFIHNLTYLPHKCMNYLNFASRNQRNNVAGSLPPWWFNSTVFTMFFIENEDDSRNHLTGPFHEYADQLPNMAAITVPKHNFSSNNGSLPQFPKGRCMCAFDVQWSYRYVATGVKIPEWNDQKHMVGMYLQYNHLIGTIPKWDNWIYPLYINLNFNYKKQSINIIPQNEPAIPSLSTIACPTLIMFGIENWNLNGTIDSLPSNTLCIPWPEKLYNDTRKHLQSYTVLKLSNNNLQGSVPFHTLTTPGMYYICIGCYACLSDS